MDLTSGECSLGHTIPINPKQLYPKFNGYGDIGQRSLKFDSYYSLIDYQIHIETGRNMWFL